MGYFDSEDVMAMGYFDFIGLLKILRDKGYELTLYSVERDKFYIRLTNWDWKTGRRFKVEEVVSLRSIEQCQNGSSYTLCNIFLGLLERLDSQTQGFKRYAESVELPDDKET